MKPLVAGRLAIAAIPALTAVAFWSSFPDAFALPKATVVVVGALLVLALMAVGWSGPLVAPRFTVLVVAFGALLVLATVTAHQPLPALAGGRMRFAGTSTYLACGFLAVATVQLFDRRSVRWIVWALLGAGAVVAGYAVLQHQGLRAFHVPFTTAPEVSTMGNVDFLSGWLAIVTPLAVWAALTRSHADGVALLGAGVAFVSVLVTFQIGTSQGVVASAVGVAVVLLAWLHERGWVTRRRLAVSAALVLVLGIGALPLLRKELDQGLYDRRVIWSVALIDIGHRPVLGHGPDTFSDRWFALRAEDVRACRMSTGIHVNAGSTHDIPLDMAVGGGVPLLVSYLLVVGFVGLQLVRGLRSQRGEERLLLAGLGGAWVAYQVQSLVSVDQPALVVAHWVLAGAVVVAARGGAPIAPGGRGRGDRAIGGLVALAALAAVVPATRPLRAEVDLVAALRADARGESAATIHQLESAIELAPWVAVYHSYLAVRVPPAREFVEAQRAAELAPGDPAMAAEASAAASRIGDEAAMRRWRAAAIRDDPCNNVGTGRS